MKKLFLLLVLASCSIGPQYIPPCPEMPLKWHSETVNGMDSDADVTDNCWESLNDPCLTSLIQRANEQNLDLFIAATRILEARVERNGKSYDYLPHVDASITGGHLYYNRKGILNQVFDCTRNKKNVNFFEAGFDASWEIDLFGKTAHEIRALQAKAEATEETYSDLWLTLSAEVARNYIELRAAQRRLCILMNHIGVQKEIVHLNEELLQIGSLSSIQVNSSFEQLFQLEAKKPLLELAISKTIYRLSVLLGCNPGTLFEELYSFKDLPKAPFYKPIGLPSDLLRRRPDINRAERNLAAAHEDIGSAMAALYPSFSLKGFIGGINSHLPSIFSPESFLFYLAPQILAPVFNSKMLQQDVCYNQLKSQEAYWEYKKAVLNALEEAENAIAAYRYDCERSQRLEDALAASKEAFTTSYDLFERGIKTYSEILLLHHSVLDAEEAYLQSQATLFADYIALYKSLGGGFYWK